MTAKELIVLSNDNTAERNGANTALIVMLDDPLLVARVPSPEYKPVIV